MYIMYNIKLSKLHDHVLLLLILFEILMATKKEGVTEVNTKRCYMMYHVYEYVTYIFILITYVIINFTNRRT